MNRAFLPQEQAAATAVAEALEQSGEFTATTLTMTALGCRIVATVDTHTGPVTLMIAVTACP